MELLIGSHSDFIFWIAGTTEAENSNDKSALFNFTNLSIVGNVNQSNPTKILMAQAGSR